MVALLRAVNVGGRKLPMAELRQLCGELGWTQVATYIQSGNVVFTATDAAEAVEAQLEQAIERRFGLDVPVVARTAAQWARYPAGNPFPDVARDDPGRLHLLLAKRAPADGADRAIQARAAAGEEVRRAGDALWIHYPNGAGASKLTPTLIDKAIGSSATARNYRTVATLLEMLGG
jgi:uncharacterized protein (DUF1697 family)